MSKYFLTVHSSKGYSDRYFLSVDDMAKFEARDSGILFVQHGGGEQFTVYAPGQWTYVDVTEADE